MVFKDMFIERDNLPGVLSADITKELLLKSSLGDIDARNELILHNIRLVISRADRFVGYEKQDLVSIGFFGLIKAINTFNIEKNVKFSTYASRCIDNEILMFFHSKEKDNNNCSFDEPVICDEGDCDLKYKDILYNLDDLTSEEEFIQRELYDTLITKVCSLKKLDRKIVVMKFGLFHGEVYSQKEIAQKLGITQAYVSKIMIRSLKKLKDDIIKERLIDRDNNEYNNSYNEMYNQRKMIRKRTNSKCLSKTGEMVRSSDDNRITIDEENFSIPNKKLIKKNR